MDLVTLWQLRDELGIADDETGDDKTLRRLLRDGGNWIETIYCQRRFDVRRETQALDYPIRPRQRFGSYPVSAAWMVSELAAVNDASNGILRLKDDLLVALSVTNGDGTAVAAGDFWYEPAATTPHFALRMKESASQAWVPGSNNNTRQCIPVDGLWGYHTNYEQAWADSLDTVEDNPLGASTTVITVNDADGLPEDSDELRFQVGQLLRLGTASAFELVALRVVTLGTPDRLTVKRGVNGTTAAAWPQDTPISIWRPELSVARGLMRLSTWLYRLKDVTFYERISILGTGTKVAPGAIPDDVIGLLPAPRPPSLAD